MPAWRAVVEAIPKRASKLYYRRFGLRDCNPSGVDIREADWDNLLILDACRYDTFVEHASLPGETHKRQSRASTTNKFIEVNVRGRDFTDTVCVTATPSYVDNEVQSAFHDVTNLWEDHWDEDLCTVHPEVVAEHAIRAEEEYPDKRILAHFLQPHYPFIGPTGQRDFDYDGYEEARSDTTKFWHSVGTRIDDVPHDTVERAYVENLTETLPYVEELPTTLQGKTVVTADHGEMLDDRAWPLPIRIYGHPKAMYVPELVEVPWHEYTNGNRKSIIDGVKTNAIDFNDQTVRNRLADLGYK